MHFSGKDNMVPSGDESRRLRKSLQNCTVRYFKENGHTLLLVRTMVDNTMMLCWQKHSLIYKKNPHSCQEIIKTALYSPIIKNEQCCLAGIQCFKFGFLFQGLKVQHSSTSHWAFLYSKSSITLVQYSEILYLRNAQKLWFDWFEQAILKAWKCCHLILFLSHQLT